MLLLLCVGEMSLGRYAASLVLEAAIRYFVFPFLGASLSVVPQSHIYVWFVKLSLQGRFANGKCIMKISFELCLCKRTHETEIC